MAWLRLSDNWPDGPEILPLTAPAFRTYIEAMCYVARYATDGHIPAAVLKTRDTRATSELVKRGLWEPTEAGYYAPLWRDFALSRADSERARAATAERVRRHRRGET